MNHDSVINHHSCPFVSLSIHRTPVNPWLCHFFDTLCTMSQRKEAAGGERIDLRHGHGHSWYPPPSFPSPEGGRRQRAHVCPFAPGDHADPRFWGFGNRTEVIVRKVKRAFGVWTDCMIGISICDQYGH